MESIKFCTGSTYRGSFDMSKHIMNGFGTYTYPDGSTYRGSFMNGRFHGMGQIKLAAPYNMTISGMFIDGKLVTIQGIRFNDGLRFSQSSNSYGKENDNGFTNWSYCNGDDRRYFREHYEGLTPPVEKGNVTARRFDRPLREGCYDTEEGFYWPVTGFMQTNDPRYKGNRFVVCPKEDAWIRRNCRYGDSQSKNPGFEPRSVFPEIIKNNVKAMQEMDAADRKSNERSKTNEPTPPPLMCGNLLSASLDDRAKCPSVDRSECLSVDRDECYLTESNSSCELDSLASSLLRHTIMLPCPSPKSSMRTSLNKETREVQFEPEVFEFVHFSGGNVDGDMLSIKSYELMKDVDSKDKVNELRQTRVKFHNVLTKSSH